MYFISAGEVFLVTVGKWSARMEWHNPPSGASSQPVLLLKLKVLRALKINYLLRIIGGDRKKIDKCQRRLIPSLAYSISQVGAGAISYEAA